MPNVNIYIPGDLHARLKAKSIPVSQVCQAAIRAALGDDQEPVVEDPVEKTLAEIDQLGKTLTTVRAGMVRIANRIENEWNAT